MGSSEEVKPPNPEKPSSTAKDKSILRLHVYPDWANMQAYYGRQFTVPPYPNSAVASPHIPPPYMWIPPQYMMPPYGASYPLFFAHQGSYGRPGVSTAGTCFNTDTRGESSGNTDGGSTKKKKKLKLSESEETGDSSSGSNGVTRMNMVQKEQELKREKRKVSNRESARRLRLRKEAEDEELATKVEKLISENMNLKSEIDKFREISKKVELENATLMERLQDARNSNKIHGLREDDDSESRNRAAELLLLLDTVLSSEMELTFSTD